MIPVEMLHARVLSELDMTRDTSDEELTRLIYRILKEASEEEYLSLEQRTT